MLVSRCFDYYSFVVYFEVTVMPFALFFLLIALGVWIFFWWLYVSFSFFFFFSSSVKNFFNILMHIGE